MNTTLENQLNKYNLSKAAKADITEAVNAMQNYVKLPLATKDSLQAICDVFNVILHFQHCKQNKHYFILCGITKPHQMSSYLFPDGKINESQKWLKKCKNKYMLLPGADSILTPEE